MKLLKDPGFWSASAMILFTAFLSSATFLHWVNLRFTVGPLFFTHFLGWIGVLFIASYTPIYYVLKRRRPKRIKPLVRVHVFGNLFAVMLVSIHFSQQLGRPAEFYPELGTGLTLYIVTLILVATGYMHRFHILDRFRRYGVFLPHQNRFVHIAITLSFYVVIFVHVLRNVGIL